MKVSITDRKRSEFKEELLPRIKEIKFSFNRFKKSPLSLMGLTLIIFFLGIAIFAPQLAPPKYPHNP